MTMRTRMNFHMKKNAAIEMNNTEKKTVMTIAVMSSMKKYFCD
jgi:hypothetical protein